MSSKYSLSDYGLLMRCYTSKKDHYIENITREK